MRFEGLLTLDQVRCTVLRQEVSNRKDWYVGDEVTAHDFDAVVSHLNEATCTTESGEQNGKQKKNEKNCTRKTQDKVEKAHVLEPNRPGFESQFFRSLVPSTVSRLLTCLKSSILVYQKRRLIPHTLEGFMKFINYLVAQCTIVII